MILVNIACALLIDECLFEGYFTGKVKSLLSKVKSVATVRKKG